MAKIFRTDSDVPSGSATEALHVYNGYDCCITLEVLNAIAPQLDEVTFPTYRKAFALQAPILEMELRGIRVDKSKIGTVSRRLEADQKTVLDSLSQIISEGLGCEPINPGSWQQVQRLLYTDMGLPPVRKKGQVTSDRKALEKLRGYFYAEPIINHILTYRDLAKQLGVLRTGIDSDGRIRTSFNIAGTDTGRFSSYESATGSGTNLQNITERLREIFIADPGKKFAYIDLEQAESRGVGAICWNHSLGGTYLDFCESGDLHTNVCRMTWPNLGWTDDVKANKKIAQQLFYRQDDYRQASKKLGHGSNYYGKPPNMARETHIPVALVTEFQRAYFQAFPEIPAWHKLTRTKLIKDGWITSMMGRRRWFFGRRYDDDTLKQAIAYDPQGSVGDYLSQGIIAIYNSDLPVEILIQVHDALLIQYNEKDEDFVVPAVQKLMEQEIPLMNGRSLVIPTEAMVGWNWAKARNSKKEVINPDGLEPFTGGDSRKRSAEVSIMDRFVL